MAGYYPLAPWAGFAVLCGWTAVALGLAVLMLRRKGRADWRAASCSGGVTRKLYAVVP